MWTITTSHSRKYSKQRLLKNTGHLFKKKPRQDRGLPFYPSVQHVHNTEMMLQCEKSGQWRLIYASKKLTHTQKQQLERVLDHISFSCGMQLQDYSDLPRLDGHGFHEKSRLQWTNRKAVLFSEVRRHLHTLFIRECQSMEWHWRVLPTVWKLFWESKIPNVKAQRKKTCRK